MFAMKRQRPPLAARLFAISRAADLRAWRVCRRFQWSRGEFPEIDAFCIRHVTYANRAFAAANVAAGIGLRVGNGNAAALLYGGPDAQLIQPFGDNLDAVQS